METSPNPEAERFDFSRIEALSQQTQDDFAPGELDMIVAQGETSLRTQRAIPADKVFAELDRMSNQRRGQKR